MPTRLKTRKLPVTSLGDSKLRVAITGLAASRPQAEIAADITTSLEALLFAKRQDEGQRCEVADPIDLDQRLRRRIRGLGYSSYSLNTASLASP